MLKWTEIEILKDTAAKLGPNSYTGAWLYDCLPEIESRIRSDFPVDADTVIGPRKAGALAVQILTEAREQANTITADARVAADRILQQARDQARRESDATRQTLIRALQKSIDAL